LADGGPPAQQWQTILTFVNTNSAPATATGQAGLVSQFENQLAADAHKSFNERLDNIYTTLTQVCSMIPDVCSEYKSVFHPDLPPSAPLGILHPKR
jgi:hypothetical protein